MNVPDWLKRRAGEVKPGLNERTWLVVVGGKPLYRLVATPANGKFTCAVSATVNGKRVDYGRAYSDQNSALVGGLDELRERLGWG